MKCLVALFVVAIFGWGSAGYSQAPAPIEAMNDLPNAAQLMLVYCSQDGKTCVTRRAICYGQCGDQYTADDMGYGCSGDIEGTVPPRFHYARWFAVDYATGKRYGGVATKGYDTRNCHNPR
jgi:hypothetical protein